MPADASSNAPALAALAEALPGAVLHSGEDRGEVTVEIAPEMVVETCRFLRSQQAFERLSSVTAVDRHPLEPRFELVYHLHSLSANRRLRLKCRLGGEAPEADSVSGVWRAADWYEREVFDLFGIRFRGHPDLRRILLPDDWEGHPLRKDYPVHGYRYSYTDEERP